MNITDEKKALRARMRALRDGLETDDRLEWDQAITDHVLALPALAAHQGPVAGFWPIGSEADARQILVGLSQRSCPTCLPVVLDGVLRFCRWTPWDPVGPGGFGTLVPLDGAEFVEPRALIVPLLAFDAEGYRIGYGKGYYDHAIARLSGAAPLLTIGIAYACQEVAAIPREAHDRRLDFIVSERCVIHSSGKPA